MEIITTGKENIQLENNPFEKKTSPSSNFKRVLSQTLIELSMEKKREAKDELKQNQVQREENIHLLRELFLEERQVISKEMMGLKAKLSSDQITRDEYYNSLSLLSSKSQEADRAYRKQSKEVRKGVQEEARQYIEEIKDVQRMQRGVRPEGFILKAQEKGFIGRTPFEILEGEATITPGSINIALKGKMRIGNVEITTLPEDKEVDFLVLDVFRLEKNRMILQQIDKVTLKDGGEVKITSTKKEFEPMTYSSREKEETIGLAESIVIRGVTRRAGGNIAPEKPPAPVPPPPVPDPVPGPKKWSFMVYLDADNDLESAAIADLNEMEMVGSSDEVNIITQLDRIGGHDSSNGDWTGTRRYYVNQDSDPATITSGLIQDLGEVNMGSSATLSDFVNSTIQNYPAENYALILWNHGNGYKGVCLDESSGNDDLSMGDLKDALEQVGTKIELVGFDACLMGMTEVAHQIKDQAEVMVASEEALSTEGWPYDTILNDLVANPDLTPADLGTVMVNRYGQHYAGSNATQGAVDLAQMANLANSISTLADSMGDPYWNEIKNLRSATEEYINNTYVDLYRFADLISQNVGDATIQNNANDVKTKIDSAVIAEWHDPTTHPNSHGLAIYFPEVSGSVNSDYDGSVIDFPADTAWDEFLERFVTK